MTTFSTVKLKANTLYADLSQAAGIVHKIVINRHLRTFFYIRGLTSHWLVQDTVFTQEVH